MRADKDIIARDRAGVERFVAFGSDMPTGWEYVRDAEGSVLPPDAEAPRTVGNVDAAQARAERLEGDVDRQRARTESAGESVATPELDAQVEPIRPVDEETKTGDAPKRSRRSK